MGNNLITTQINELATRDELTGLFNRRHMLEVLAAERLRVDRTKRPFCICVIDLDKFKVINDRHGHGVGDEALCAAAHTIASGLRDSDVVARWGGEEFLIMFTDTDCDAAAQVLERVRQDLSRRTVSATVQRSSLSP